MLRNSFVLLDGIGPTRERALWRSGILTWDDFLSSCSLPRVSAERKREMDAHLDAAVERLESQDSRYFADRLALREHWRCLRSFSGTTAYLDIETTGISFRSPVTMVGIYDGKRMHTLVRGQNLTHAGLKAILHSVAMIVTFNGSGFDLPVLEAQFPGSVPRVPHVDLRNVLRKLGHTGGLKAIERRLGVERDRRVEYMTGADAVYLWRAWEKTGNENALRLLSEYNAEDCRNLKVLADFAYRKMKGSLFDPLAVPHNVE